MLTLALLRHAKSSWNPIVLDDFDRPLNDRGLKAAPRMGRVIADIGLAPDIILCSSAKRTRETLTLAREAWTHHNDTPISYEDGLYLAEPESLLTRVKKLPDDVTSALLVGHNPGLEELAQLLVKTGDAKSIIALENKYPTGALAVFTFPTTRFAEIGPELGHLEHFITPRGSA